MTSPKCIVRMENIKKHFAGRAALDGADLELREGEILGLVGDNGAGKSTLLKVLSGVLTGYRGEIFVEGAPAPIASPRFARDLGIEMVYQDLSLCGCLSVWENIYLGRYLTRRILPFLPVVDKGRMAAGAREALEALGIHLADLNVPARSLSGGEQQAVAMCRCLLFKPRVLLLDEPTASMAVWEQERILGMIRTLREQGCSLVMVTHNLEELFRVADRVLVLKGGRSVWCGPISGLQPDDLARMMFLGKGKENQ